MTILKKLKDYVTSSQVKEEMKVLRERISELNERIAISKFIIKKLQQKSLTKKEKMNLINLIL